MHIDKFTVCGRSYLRLVKSKRRLTRNGKPISGKELVLGLGPLAKHDDGKPDYLARLRESFRRGDPLIEELKQFVGEAAKEKVRVEFEQGSAECFGHPKRMAPVILDRVFEALELDELLASIKHDSKIQFDLQGIVRLLVYGRLLDPASKSATMGQKDKYYRPMVRSENDDNVYDALDILQRNRGKILRRMNTCISRATGRTGGTIFYDVTNFFFEIGGPDADAVDDDGNVTATGFRKNGVSKENRKEPIVQLGLFMDDDGIPISIEEFPGNTLDHHTLKPAMKKSVDALALDRFILVADRGMYTGPNVCHVTDAGNGYIVSRSLRKSSKVDQDWAIDEKGYVRIGDDCKVKSRIVTRKTKDESGKVRTFKEKVVVYWSRAFYEREIYENRKFLTFIEQLKKNPNGFRITAANSLMLRKFLKKDVLNKKTGEVLDGTKLIALIDDEKLSQFNRLFGYYQIATSELEMDDQEIIDKYHGLTQIEDQFREMKGTLETRPVFVSTEDHIRAHLLICFIALTMLRLIQRKTKQQLGENCGEEKHWTYGIPGARISTALREWQVDELPKEYYRMQNCDNDDLKMILKAFGVKLEPKIYTKGDIRDLKSAIVPL